MYFMSINKVKPDVDHAEFNKAIAAHREWVRKLLAAGVLVQAGKWGDTDAGGSISHHCIRLEKERCSKSDNGMGHGQSRNQILAKTSKLIPGRR
jgi:uncharacterized protein YciI